MADLSITAANVAVGGSELQYAFIQFGEAVTQGQSVYLKASDGKYWKADADAVETAEGQGLVLTPSATDGYGFIATDGPMIVGATLVVGTTYVVSTTAGGIAPIADLGAGDFPCILGTAITTAILQINIAFTGVAKA